MKLLLFTGAGASVELGVPAMRRMVQGLHDHLRNQDLAPSVLNRFEKMLSDADYDMEKLIEAVDNVEKGAEEQKNLGFDVDEELLSTVRMMRWEAEWFIQHACDRLLEFEAATLWGAALRRVDDHEICFVTTNYDRSIEIGCSFSGVTLDDGFESFNGREFAKWKGIDNESLLKILKIHGSIDWYQGDDSFVYKLRHPMPLYGDLAISEVGCDLPKMTSAIVLPTREKKINTPPYPDLATDFRITARNAHFAIFLGTSLRDPDVLNICRQCAERIPTYFVSIEREHSDILLPPKAKVILQTASEFLVSTLPRFLDSSDSNFLDKISTIESDERPSVLSWLVTALDATQTPNKICGAIENLVDNNVAMDFFALRPLLKHADSSVRNFALALIPNSIDRNKVLDLAEKLASVQPDAPFAKELDMLKELMENRG